MLRRRRDVDRKQLADLQHFFDNDFVEIEADGLAAVAAQQQAQPGVDGKAAKDDFLRPRLGVFKQLAPDRPVRERESVRVVDEFVWLPWSGRCLVIATSNTAAKCACTAGHGHNIMLEFLVKFYCETPAIS